MFIPPYANFLEQLNLDRIIYINILSMIHKNKL